MSATEVQQLESRMAEIHALAVGFGLDPYAVHFELVPATMMYEFGAYGIPGRFSHWTHGRAYQQIKTMYDYGLSKIYELVINTDPAYAFLLENNSVLQNSLVAAHVLAHVDFFKKNIYFGRTNRGMLETVSIHAERMRRYEFEHGRETVEGLLDAVLSIQEHVESPPVASRAERAPDPRDPTPARPENVHRVGPYDDLVYIGATSRPEAPPPETRFPAEPEKDLLRFLADHAPDLEDWERDVILMVRAEQRYFAPQMQTKIMNEGWASYWHLRIMRELDLPEQDYLEFARLHSGVLAPGGRGINPYYVGLKIFEDIERRWDEPPTEGEDDHVTPRPGMSRGRAKVFEVRELDDDSSFLRNYLTEELVKDLDLYVYRREHDRWVVAEKNWEIVRDSILASMTNFGQPYIIVQDGDYRGSRELYLKHCFEGHELDLEYGEKTLRFVRRLWGRPVHLETVRDGDRTVLSCADIALRTQVSGG